jgi:GNAT superfamily N-acetyltransferase
VATDLSIRRLTNADGRFYPLLGPFLARREVVRDIGGPIWDDDDKMWFVAVSDGAVVGFCAARDTGRRVTFQSAYVVPGHRRRGVYRALFAARLGHYADRPIRAMCTAASLPMFVTHGFVKIRTRGAFTEVNRDGI